MYEKMIKDEISFHIQHKGITKKGAYYEEGFIDGAEWVVNKIKGGQE